MKNPIIANRKFDLSKYPKQVGDLFNTADAYALLAQHTYDLALQEAWEKLAHLAYSAGVTCKIGFDKKGDCTAWRSTLEKELAQVQLAQVQAAKAATNRKAVEDAIKEAQEACRK